jgi:hypothetical protein
MEHLRAELLSAQDGRCAICGAERGTRRLAIDHDHTTGFIRGLLCVRCNTGLGSFRDDPELLRKAIEYLDRAAKEAAA